MILCTLLPFSQCQALTLNDILQSQGYKQKVRVPKADQPITSYNVLSTADEWMIAYYHYDNLDPIALKNELWIVRWNKKTSDLEYRAYPMKQIFRANPYHHLGSILDIIKHKDFYFLKGHSTPSACPTLVLNHKLDLYDVLPGWIIETVKDGCVIYQENKVHFAELQPDRFVQYDPVTTSETLLEPDHSIHLYEKKVWSKDEAVVSVDVMDPLDDQPSRPAELAYALTYPAFNQDGIFITVHAGVVNVIRIFIEDKSGLHLLKEIKAPYAFIPRPQVFYYKPEGEKRSRQFIHITEVAHGTGHFTTEHIFHVAYDGRILLHPVNLISPVQTLSPQFNSGEGVWKGVHTELSDHGLFFEFYIWNEGDGNCCPTAGRVIGTYKIVLEKDGQKKRYTLVMDTFKRHQIVGQE